MNNQRVLIVDDDIANIQTIAGLLEQTHPEYRLFQATRGAIALDIARIQKIDLIISDWDMPGMNGIELAKAIKSGKETQHIAVIIVTGVMLTPADLEEALSAGAFDYIRKPVDPVELSARTHSALRFVSMHLEEIRNKNVELDEKALLLVKNNQFKIGLVKKLNLFLETGELNENSVVTIKNMITDIKDKISQDNWQHFEVAFQNVHPGFCNNLLSGFPTLTPAELKHSILIMLGLNIKDMAAVLNQHPDSIKVTRSRIRKKIGIPNETNLQTYLSGF